MNMFASITREDIVFLLFYFSASILVALTLLVASSEI